MFNFKVVITFFVLLMSIPLLEASSSRCRKLLREGKSSIKVCARLKKTTEKMRCADRVQKKLERKIKRIGGKNKCPKLMDKVGSYAERIGRK